MIRIGILGAARISVRALIEAAAGVPEVRVHAVAARSRARASDFAALHGIPRSYGSYQELLADPDIDAIYNPLPNSGHGPWTLRAIAAGKHVLCEKPFAGNAGLAGQVASAASASGLTVMEAMHYRYHPLVTRLAEETRALGALHRIQCWTTFPITDPADIRYDFDLGGGATMDGGCYALDCIRLLSGASGGVSGGGEPEVEAAVAQTVPRDVDVSLAARLRLPSGGTAWFDSAFTFDGEFRADVHVVGEHGHLWLRNFIGAHDGQLTVTRDGSAASSVTGAAAGGGETTYTYQLRAFAAAIHSGAPYPTTPENGLATMRLIDASYQAAGLPSRPLPRNDHGDCGVDRPLVR
jgi:predicted dehydrogenase